MKSRILEKRYKTRSEFHPQYFIKGGIYQPSRLGKFFGKKPIITPDRWVSWFDYGLKSLEDANYFLSRITEWNAVARKMSENEEPILIVHEV